MDESSALIEAESRGIAKGIAEANLATARAMIAKGLSDELISEITHLLLLLIHLLLILLRFWGY